MITQPVAAAPVETVETVRTVSTDVGPRRVSHRRVSRSRTAPRHHDADHYARDRPGSGRRRCAGRGRAAGLHHSREPLYDVAPGAAYVAPAVTVAPTYQYIYEPGRILVVDPVTGIAVQSIPR